MTDSSVLVANERIKSISNLMFNAGGGLVAATIIRFYSTLALDWALAVWSIGAGTLIWFGWMTLSLLESETKMFAVPPFIAELAPGVIGIVGAIVGWFAAKHAHDRGQRKSAEARAKL